MAQSLLYYPTINIKDSMWLRSAILYWDEICSIVPDQQYSDLSPEIRYLQDNNIYRAIYPEDIFFASHNDEFLKSLCRRMNLSKRRKDYSKRYEKVHDSFLYNSIHYKKIPRDILEEFLEKGFVRIINDSPWLEMEAGLIEIYMRTLAEFAAKYDQKDMVLSTDKYYKIGDIFKKTKPEKKQSIISA